MGKLHVINNYHLDVYKTLYSDYIDLDFILPGLLKGSVGAIVGPGSAGKSFLALEIAATVALYGKWNPLEIDLPMKSETYNRSFPNDIVNVSYITGEDPLEIAHNRLVTIAGNLDNDKRDRFGSSFSVTGLRGLSPYLMYMENGVVKRNEKWIDSLKRGLGGVDLAILDTLTKFHALEENSNDSMKQLIDLFDEIASECGCSIIFLHHSNKVAMRENKGDDQTASRGASALTDNIRWQMNLRTMNKDEADRNYDVDNPKSWVLWSGSKINYAEAPDGEGDLWLHRGQGSKGLLIRDDPPKKKKGKEKDEAQF